MNRITCLHAPAKKFRNLSCALSTVKFYDSCSRQRSLPPISVVCELAGILSILWFILATFLGKDSTCEFS